MVATVLTLFLVPVLYTVAVRDLKLIQWEKPPSTTAFDQLRVVDLSDEETRLKPKAVNRFDAPPPARVEIPVPSQVLPKAAETRVDTRAAEEEDESTHILPKEKKVEVALDDDDDEATVRDDRRKK